MPLTRLAPIVARDLDRQWGEPADIPAEALLDPANYQNFAITDDAVVFYFDKNALRAATGNAQVSVPRTAIVDLWPPAAEDDSPRG